MRAVRVRVRVNTGRNGEKRGASCTHLDRRDGRREGHGRAEGRVERRRAAFRRRDALHRLHDAGHRHGGRVAHGRGRHVRHLHLGARHGAAEACVLQGLREHPLLGGRVQRVFELRGGALAGHHAVLCAARLRYVLHRVEKRRGWM